VGVRRPLLAYHPAQVHPAERCFALVATVGGLAVLLVLPPFEVPDEPAHFFRAYEVSEGGLVARRYEGRVGAFVPASLVPVVQLAFGIPFHADQKQDPQAVRALFGQPLVPRERVFVDFPNTALVSPLCYLPQAAGIAAGRLFGASPITLFYSGRLANLVCWIALMLSAVHATPVRKWLFVALALTPMSLQQGASLSADAFTNAACFLFVALCLRARFAEGTLTRREIARLVVLAAAIALCKFVYSLVPLSVFLIPAPRFGSSRRRWLVCAGLVTAVCAAALAWGAAAHRVHTTYDAYAATHRDAVALIPGAVPRLQMDVIAHDPARYAGIVATSLTRTSGFVLDSFVGLLGWGETRLRAGHVAGHVILLFVLAILGEAPARSLSWRDRALCGALAAGSLNLICTALYLQWTPVGREWIDGLHGRYLIPFGPLMFLVLQNGRLHVPARVLHAAASLAVATSTGLMIATLLDRYY
jgi:uncharacterized membrane protein